jgi:hypothetical protein
MFLFVTERAVINMVHVIWSFYEVVEFFFQLSVTESVSMGRDLNREKDYNVLSLFTLSFLLRN